MSTTAPTRLEALAVCRAHRDYYRAQADRECNTKEYGRATMSAAAAEVVVRIMDTLTGDKPPLGARKA